jgi:glycosyltransferase involved in cell wall biosynthesis
MQISLICCPFKTSFGSYARSLKAAIEKKTGDPVQWVASNCGCGTPVATNREFLLPKEKYVYFEGLIPGDYVAKQAWRRQLRHAARTMFTYFKARRYAQLSKNAEVVHFHQVLNAYGAKALFHWLRQPSNATRIVTVHELDPDQLDAPESNRAYNLADGIIVHCEDMRQHLLRLNVQEDKIHVVLHGTELPATLHEGPKEGIVFYGGHFLTHNKGLDSLFKAMLILKQKMGADAPKLKINGHYGMDLKEEAVRLSEQIGVANDIVWLDQISDEAATDLYLRSQLCVLPYTGSFAGLPAALAAACGLPVVSTRKAGLPDHLGDCGIWVEENNPEQLAGKLLELLGNDRLRQGAGAKVRQRAESALGWDTIANQTLLVYEDSMRKRAAAVAKRGRASREESMSVA